MVRLGAVTAAAVEPGKVVTAAFQGKLLNRPSGAGREARAGGAARPVPRRLRRAAVGAAARQAEPGGRPAAFLHRVAALDGERGARRTRRLDPAGRLGLRAAGHLPLRPATRSTSRARGAGRSRRPTTRTAPRPRSARFVVDYTADRARSADDRARARPSASRSRAPRASRCRSRPPRGAVIASLPAAQLDTGRGLAYLGRHDHGRREGPERTVRRPRHRDERGRNVEPLRALHAAALGSGR